MVKNRTPHLRHIQIEIEQYWIMHFLVLHHHHGTCQRFFLSRSAGFATGKSLATKLTMLPGSHKYVMKLQTFLGAKKSTWAQNKSDNCVSQVGPVRAWVNTWNPRNIETLIAWLLWLPCQNPTNTWHLRCTVSQWHQAQLSKCNPNSHQSARTCSRWSWPQLVPGRFRSSSFQPWVRE